MHCSVKSMKNNPITRHKKLFELSLTLSGDPMEVFQHAAKMIGKLLEVNIVCLPRNTRGAAYRAYCDQHTFLQRIRGLMMAIHFRHFPKSAVAAF